MTGALKYAIIAFVISVIAGALGFSGVSEAASGIAKIFFYIALAIGIFFLVIIVTGIKLFT